MSIVSLSPLFLLSWACFKLAAMSGDRTEPSRTPWLVAGAVLAAAGAYVYLNRKDCAFGGKTDRHEEIKKIMSRRPALKEQKFRLSGLRIYPIKSCKGVPVDRLQMDSLGPVHDRRFLIINGATGTQVTQRDNTSLALVQPRLDLENNRLILSCGSNMETSVAVPIKVSPNETQSEKRFTVTIWRVPIDTIDCGNAVSSWLTECLNKGSKRVKQVPYRLVRLGEHSYRDTNRYDTKWHNCYSDDDRAAFSDCSQYLVTFTKSLEYLQQCLPPNTIEDMGRFRPNIILESHIPFEEDWISTMEVLPRSAAATTKPVELRVNKGCHRCVMCTINQETGNRTPKMQPLNLLREFRLAKDDRFENAPCFGLNTSAMAGCQGELHVGDTVIVKQQVVTRMLDAVPVQNHSVAKRNSNGAKEKKG